MSTTILPTPADLTITSRDRKFERGELKADPSNAALLLSLVGPDEDAALRTRTN